MKEKEFPSRVFIAGPPCSGKSAAGRCLAAILSVPFIDLDAMVESEASMSIPDIFESAGEKGFRDLESRALERAVSTHGRCVISLGGGCLLRERNLRLVTAGGRLIPLTASMNRMLERRRDREGARPLAPGEDSFRELLASRAEHYRSLGDPIDTTLLSPRETAEMIMETLNG